MTLNGWIQIAIYFVVLTALVVPLGRYMARVFEGERTFLTPVLGPVERGLYRISGIDETREQHWITYTVAMLLFNAAGFAPALRVAAAAGRIAAEPAGMSAVAPDLSLQHRGQLHQQHQLAELRRRKHAQLSDADGGAHHPEFRLGGHRHRACRGADPRLRADLRQDRRQFLGRSHPLHPLRAAAAVHRRRDCSRVAGRAAKPRRLCRRDHARRRQADLSQGPAASQIAIKQLGTNGGGFWNANSAQFHTRTQRR